MNFFRWILLLCILLIAWYAIWSNTGKDYSSLRNAPASIDTTSAGTNNGRGNLVGIQPFFTPADYCDQQHFHDGLRAYFKKAQAAGWLQPKTLVVLPENTGSWLVFANEKRDVYQADSMREAVATIVNSNILNFIRNLLPTPADDKIKHALVYMKAADMAQIYTAVFSSLAKEFGVTIAAGSLVLPQPSVRYKGQDTGKKSITLLQRLFIWGRWKDNSKAGQKTTAGIQRGAAGSCGRYQYPPGCTNACGPGGDHRRRDQCYACCRFEQDQHRHLFKRLR